MKRRARSMLGIARHVQRCTRAVAGASRRAGESASERIAAVLAVLDGARVRAPRRARLVQRILALQLAITAVVGVLALAGLYWTSQAVIRNNLAHWAEQWTSQLNELGAPFYLTDESTAVLGVERFVATYPEVASVRWYGADGAPLFSVDRQGMDEAEPSPLSASTAAELAELAGSAAPHRLDEDFGGTGRFRLIGPIWTESIVGDDLPEFGADGSSATELSLLGFVGVELDFSWYRQQLRRRLALGSLILGAVLAASWAVGRRVLVRALEPLSALQRPLAELARGNMRVEFAASRYAEIQNIVGALEQTTAALRQRDERLVHLATHDPLTGLYNRHRFVEVLGADIDRLAEQGGMSAVLFIDLDQFKYINDTCGHPAGDELLRLAASCIAEETRADDVVARFGGDEFTVLARNVTRAQARRIGHDVLERMRTLTQTHNGNTFHLQCSIGVAMLQGGRLGPDEYLAQADIACHAAKSKGRNRLELYRVSDKENQQMAREFGWVQTVRRALETNAFRLVYQPLVRLRTGRAEHYEALLRLEAEPGKLVRPDAFLPAAERFGLVADIDRWVVAHALEALGTFRSTRPELRFSINLSAPMLDDAAFTDSVERMLRDHGVPPEAVVFEITEQVAVRFVGNVDKQLDGLRRLGCRFAIDDFGKGYSSFSYLKRLPVDYLKIDGSFIERLEHDTMDQTMVRVVAEIARAAGIETVAERVQSRAALHLLAKFGIDYVQGFYVGRPALEPEETELPLSARAARRVRRA